MRSLTARANRLRRRPAAASLPPAAVRSAAFFRARCSARLALRRRRSASWAAVSARSASSRFLRWTMASASSLAAALRVQSFAFRSCARLPGRPVPELGADRAACGLDPSGGGRDPPDPFGQRTGIGGVSSSSSDPPTAAGACFRDSFSSWTTVSMGVPFRTSASTPVLISYLDVRSSSEGALPQVTR